PLPRMNDLRARIAAIVDADRARRARLEPASTNGGAETLSTRGTPSLGRDGDPPRAGALGAATVAASASSYEVREQRIAIDDLALEIVGRGACDAQLLAHLGLKGEPPARWADVLFLDTETTGLSGGTGTYVFLIGVAHIS